MINKEIDQVLKSTGILSKLYDLQIVHFGAVPALDHDSIANLYKELEDKK